MYTDRTNYTKMIEEFKPQGKTRGILHNRKKIMVSNLLLANSLKALTHAINCAKGTSVHHI